MSDCDDDTSASASAFSFDCETSANEASPSSFDFGSSHGSSWSSGPPTSMRRKRKTEFTFDDMDTLDEHMDSLDAAMAPLDMGDFNAPSIKSPNNSSRLISTLPTHYEGMQFAAAQDRTLSAPALSNGQSRAKAPGAEVRKQKLPSLATSTPLVPVYSAGASSGTGGASRAKGRRRNLGLTLDCDAIQVWYLGRVYIVEPTSGVRVSCVM